MISDTDRRKQSLYLDPVVAEDLAREAARLGWSLSKVAQEAWRIARDRLQAAPTPLEAIGSALARQDPTG